ncbi:MAG: RNA polymerase sigma factor RpoD/SigA [Candidatus Tectimicrobiota bacterium]
MWKGNGHSQATRDDLLAHYLRDLSSLQTLTQEEEAELARRSHKGDREALRKLVEGNLRFVVYVAMKYRDSRIPLIDLINEGNVGLIKAAVKFNPGKGVRFVAYAIWWVVEAIKHALARQTGVIRRPLKHCSMVCTIDRKEQELAGRLGRRPTRDEVAEALGLSLRDIEVNLRAARPPLFLDASVTDDPSNGFSNALKADGQVDQRLLAAELREEMESLIETLSEREREVIRMRFGLNGYEPMTLREVGEIMGLSKSRVHQIEDRALGRLQRAAKDRTLEGCPS